MEPYYADDWLTVYHGDARTVMAQLPAESVHCVVTSPPYWGLRDYGTASWTGGDGGCDHLRSPVRAPGERLASTLVGRTDTMRAYDIATRSHQATCGKCGAVRIDSQLGLEATPEEFVANMVAVFREVRRVLRSDGTVWLNLGDSYANGGGIGGARVSAIVGNTKANVQGRGQRVDVLAQKQLVGIPWRVAFALQADGWYLRSDIIWAKPNPMPESVTDRPTKAHEYVFLLAKSARYYFDADAVREPSEPWAAQHPDSWATGMNGGHDNVRWSQRGPGDVTHGNGEIRSGRNLRTVWNIATAPYPGAHFATFPAKLVEPCVKAGTSERGVCPQCGAPWTRQTERELIVSHVQQTKRTDPSGMDFGTAADQGPRGSYDVTTTGWQPSCGHGHEPVFATVLDPFAGSGTTGMVAQSLSRRAVLIDLSMDYLKQLMDRNRDIPLGLGA